MHQEDKWLPEEFKIYSVDENDGVIYWKGKKKAKTNENFWVRVSGGGDKKEARERERETNEQDRQRKKNLTSK